MGSHPQTAKPQRHDVVSKYMEIESAVVLKVVVAKPAARKRTEDGKSCYTVRRGLTVQPCLRAALRDKPQKQQIRHEC